MANQLPSPTHQQVAMAWQAARARNFNLEHDVTTQLILVPHAAVSESHTTAAQAMLYLPPAVQQVWLIPTHHAATQQLEHSVYITEALLQPCVTSQSSFKVWWTSLPTMAEAQHFLTQRPDHVIVCTSDLSHENNKSSQQVLDQEATLLHSLTTARLHGLETVTACGSNVIRWFHECTQHLKHNVALTAYNDSKNRAHYWTDEPNSRVVSYVSAITTPSADHAMYVNIYWHLRLYQAYALSKLFHNVAVSIPLDLQLPATIRRGLFVTVKQGSATRACIGRIQPHGSILETIEQILPDLLRDATERWQSALLQRDMDKYTIELAIFATTARKITAAELKNNVLSRQRAYIMTCLSGSGTFIPSVWEEHPHWSPEEYLAELRTKAHCAENDEIQLQTYDVVSVV